MRQGGEVVGVILPATARDGYSGDIELLVADPHRRCRRRKGCSTVKHRAGTVSTCVSLMDAVF